MLAIFIQDITIGGQIDTFERLVTKLKYGVKDTGQICNLPKILSDKLLWIVIDGQKSNFSGRFKWV